MHLKFKNVIKEKDSRWHSKILIGMVGVYDEVNTKKNWQAKHKAFIPLDERMLNILETVKIPLNKIQVETLRDILKDK